MKIDKIISLSVLSSVVLFGANVPTVNSGNIEKQLIAPKVPMEKKENVQIQGLDNKDVVKTDVSDSKIFIKDFTFTGNSVISSEELKSNLKDYVNKELIFNQIQEVIANITKLYQTKGFFIGRAYLQKQDLIKNDNVLNITILEGKLDELKLNNSSLVNNSSLEAVLNGVKSNDILNVYDIEKIMLLINDRAGVMVNSVNISPGEKIGTSNFNIETVPENRVDGYVVADNYGSRYTGYNRFQGLVNINSPFNIGDKISISGLVSNGADLKNGKIAYELPLNSYGLKSDFAYTRTNYNLVEEYKSLDAKGNSNIYEAGLSYPLIRSTNENLYLKGKYYHKDMNDYMSGDKYEDKSINSFVTTLEYDKNYSIGTLPARVFANLNLTTGHLSSKNNNPNNGNYNKVDTYISNDIYFNEIFSLNTNLTAQKVLGNKNLDGSEDLTLGGPNAVKLYPYSEQSAENGYIASFELFSKLPNIASYNHKIGLFYDMGNVYQEKNLDTTFQRKTLQDIGLGYYSSFDDFFLRTQIAWGLNSKPISSEYTNHKNSKFLVQAGWVF
ncbi:ShlB/FhaC/HecB family hemolysin secretion/activation protein [Aliarcobacter cryaerophilus]|uniref:ShlB/FhaC/HecB family hemolysin secretion/activation protein n=1 Tax=Aliarcobacter cryaerophilus TaxID=28198 RepID=UPI0021B4EDAD|nr:ShlB/FhaC/HecB family hemolysin secretion/activation protein [Aliarcobacter cryaerophilus]MCT7406700.1 ShlB/FhaC/HecB family hemolysin secretion/activation protein [Aliarcobacter cryaerophilus]MCT7504436.1 ShlB/FhaC/HecB family hemolysin secretion/activation protein [Aliarcobacter cryaerophilus]